MPVSSWTPCETFDWTAPPAPAVKRRRPRPKKPRPKRKPKTRRKAAFTPQVRSLLIDRLETAVESGVIDLHDDAEHCDQLCITTGEYALLLRILFPEDYDEPRGAKKVRAPAPTDTAPGSPDRIAAYADRAARGQGLYAKGDARPGMVDGLGLKVVSRRNGSGHQVVGWADEG